MVNSSERCGHRFSQMLTTPNILSDLKQSRTQLSKTAKLGQSREAPRKRLLIFCPPKGRDSNRSPRVSKILGQRSSEEARNSLKTLSVGTGGWGGVPGGWSPF